jgi:putative membrane protein
MRQVIMKRAFWRFLTVSIALGFTVWLIFATSLTAVVQSFSSLGWGVAAVVAVRGIVIMINAIAWWRLLATLTNVPFVAFALLRWIREAIDVLLPVASIGGGLVSARLLTFWRTSGSLALAGLFADVFLQTAAQAIFALIGLLLLARVVGMTSALPVIALGLSAAVAVLGAFYLVQRFGAPRLIGSLLKTFPGLRAFRLQQKELGFQAAMDRIWHDRHRHLAAALLIHTIAWTVGTLEVWLTLHFMGWPISLEQSVVMESLGASISSAAFFIPGSWGVQEGGYLLIGEILGVPAPFALALSITKRVPDLVLGAPGLIAWRAVEARHLHSQAS